MKPGHVKIDLKTFIKDTSHMYAFFNDQRIKLLLFLTYLLLRGLTLTATFILDIILQPISSIFFNFKGNSLTRRTFCRLVKTPPQLEELAETFRPIPLQTVGNIKTKSTSTPLQLTLKMAPDKFKTLFFRIYFHSVS